MESHLESLRNVEIEAIKKWFLPGTRVLELGGGSGYQANVISSWGCEVTSIDIAGRAEPPQQFFPVQDYDGRNIPFADGTFDLVFSSNVLEHVAALSAMLQEIHRVLKPEGRSIHILPSSTWRFWTSITHYGFVLGHLLGRKRPAPGIAKAPSASEVARRRGVAYLLRRALLPGPHGEYPSALAELYYYSRRRWLRTFQTHHFRVEACSDVGLFYTGYGLLPGISLPQRQKLARLLGASGNIFVTRAVAANTPSA